MHNKVIRICYRFNHKLHNDFLENEKVLINALKCTELSIHESTLLKKSYNWYFLCNRLVNWSFEF